ALNNMPGLTIGVNAVALGGGTTSTSYVYVGPRIGQADYADYQAMLNDPANWAVHQGSGPDESFPTAGFTDDPAAQVVNFAAGSLFVEQPEGDAGTVNLVFTVERSGSNFDGDLTFSGTLEPGVGVNAADFAGPLTFSGTILTGQSSATVTIAVAGDNVLEMD